MLKEILKSPKAQEILRKHSIPCLECPFVFMEMKTLEIGNIAKTYNIDLKKLLKDLNKNFS